MLVSQLDLGEIEPRVVTREFIDLPSQLAGRDDVPDLFYDHPVPQADQRLGFDKWDVMLEFEPAQLASLRLEGERCQ